MRKEERVRLEMEARAGERKVEEGKARSQQQLQELLGKTISFPSADPKPAESNGQKASAIPPGDARPSTSHPKARLIERAPQRNPVGQTMPSGNGTKCAFFGVLDIAVREMRDADVLKVECPECLAVRGLTPAGETVRFPPHDPRKTRTPNREARWIRCEGVWELAGGAKAT
jgi:hypothetical protein